MAPVAVVFWIAIIIAAGSRGPALLYLLMISGSFGTLQMLPGSGGSANLLPMSACAAVLISKVMVQRGNITRGIEAAVDPQRLALFSGFLIYAVVGALILPRMFSGLFEVVPVSAFKYGTDTLKPGPGNITQSCYMIVSYATTLSFAIIGQSELTREHYLRSLLYGAYVLIGTGIVDLVTYTLHIGSVLDPFRTASYGLLTDVEADGAKRVVGLMSEASSYGSSCVSLLSLILFFRPLYRNGPEQAFAIVALALLGLMTMLSTSSTAIVGLGVTGIIYAFDLVVRLMDSGNVRRKHLHVEISLIAFTIFIIFATIVIKPNLFDPIISMVDKMVFQKSSSPSYVERSLWNRVGWHAFIDSGGFGAGLGSIRVSNWAISILGSTGVLGAVLMFGFILQQLLAIPHGVARRAKLFSTLAKLGLMPTLVMYQLAGTIPDIGIPAAAALGMIAAVHGIQISSVRDK